MSNNNFEIDIATCAAHRSQTKNPTPETSTAGAKPCARFTGLNETGARLRSLAGYRQGSVGHTGVIHADQGALTIIVVRLLVGAAVIIGLTAAGALSALTRPGHTVVVVSADVSIVTWRALCGDGGGTLSRGRVAAGLQTRTGGRARHDRRGVQLAMTVKAKEDTIAEVIVIMNGAVRIAGA